MKCRWIVLMVLFVFVFCLCSGCSPKEESQTTQTQDDGGVYDGETDPDGKRSGYGVWVYGDFRYEGNWINDLPNGEGTLIMTVVPAEDMPPLNYPKEILVRGNWTEGLANGDIVLTWVTDEASREYRMEVQNGYPVNIGTGEIPEEGETNIWLVVSDEWIIAAVPPWEGSPSVRELILQP